MQNCENTIPYIRVLKSLKFNSPIKDASDNITLEGYQSDTLQQEEPNKIIVESSELLEPLEHSSKICEKSLSDLMYNYDMKVLRPAKMKKTI